MQLTHNLKTILTAVAAGATNTKEIAEATGLSPQSVGSSLGAAKKNDLIVVDGEKLTMTDIAKRAIGLVEGADGRKARTSGKAVKARSIFAEMTEAGSPRKDVIARFQAELGMSKATAATYYQNAKNVLK